MKRLISLLALGFAAAAHAYTPDELREDCRAADDFYAGKKTSDPYASLRSARRTAGRGRTLASRSRAPRRRMATLCGWR